MEYMENRSNKNFVIDTNCVESSKTEVGKCIENSCSSSFLDVDK